MFYGCGGLTSGFIDAGYDLLSIKDYDLPSSKSYDRNFGASKGLSICSYPLKNS
jgi:site-specific DNA-cytosine methylase